MANWECIRATSYVFPDTPIPNAEALEGDGFEIALHLHAGCPNNFTPASLRASWDEQLPDWRGEFPTLNAPVTNRTHCISWSDWASEPIVEHENGVRFDTNYYYWPGEWVQNRPGMFTGSGFPMRFANTDGSLIDVYQATTQLTDESDIDYGLHIAALLDGALGPQGYYGVFTANMHTDSPEHPGADAIVAAAKARGVPVVSSKQMLTWLDGRNVSSFDGLGFSSNVLQFSIQPGTGANGLQAMLPVEGPTGALTGVKRGGATVTTTTRTVGGTDYVLFDADRRRLHRDLRRPAGRAGAGDLDHRPQRGRAARRRRASPRTSRAPRSSAASTAPPSARAARRCSSPASPTARTRSPSARSGPAGPTRPRPRAPS